MCVQALSSLQAYIITVLVGLIARYLWCSIFSVCISGIPSTIKNELREAIFVSTIRFGPKKKIWVQKNLASFSIIYGVLSFCEEKRIQEGISLPLVSNRSCRSAHPQSGSIFLLVNEKLSDAKISIISSTFPAVKCHCLETIEGRVVI